MIVLCYRAGESIRGVIEPLARELDDDGVDYELVLVANSWPGQPDPTRGVIEAYEGDRVRVVDREKRGAMGWDMRSGFEAATGAIMIAIDGDAQNPTEDVLRMYRMMRHTGADVTKGVRIARFDGLYRRLISLGYNFVFRAVFGTHGIWDINGKPKGLTRAAYEQMSLRADDWFIDAEIVIQAQKLGLTLAEMPVVFRRNEARASFVRTSAIWEFVVNIARYRLRSNRR